MIDPKQKLEALNSELQQIVNNFNEANKVAEMLLLLLEFLLLSLKPISKHSGIRVYLVIVHTLNIVI